MMDKISEDTLERVSRLAKLELSAEEKQDTRQGLEEMLLFMETVREVCTDGVEPLTHPFMAQQSLREDEVTNITELTGKETGHKEDNGMFKVPHTLG
jgi:aspartyl-tRNA(Asn)/glutamyl-tRNA(Gln) amidotransferase subunit C